jgi:hypothetical protein
VRPVVRPPFSTATSCADEREIAAAHRVQAARFLD